MKIKTSELEGAALDWTVARATGCDTFTDAGGVLRHGPDAKGWHPSTDWSQSGPLIDRYAMLVEHDSAPGETAECAAYAWKRDGSHACAFGGSALVAICRAVAWLELGDTVDVPEELLK